MEETPLVGEGKGAGEENAAAPSEPELFTLLPGEVELHRGAGHSSRTDQVGDRDSIHDARCTGRHEEDATGKPAGGPESDWGFVGGFWFSKSRGHWVKRTTVGPQGGSWDLRRLRGLSRVQGGERWPREAACP